MTSSDIQTLLGVEHTQRLDGFVEIGEWFSLPHEDNAGDAFAEVPTNVDNLIDDFLRSERPGESRETRCAEGASHAASRLGGNAHGQAVARRHTDGFHGDTVWKLKEVFAGPVFRDLFDGFDGNSEGESFGKGFSQGLGDVGHLIKRTYVLSKEPFRDLLGTEGGLSKLRDDVGDVLGAQRADIRKGLGALHTKPFCETIDGVQAQTAYMPIQ